MRTGALGAALLALGGCAGGVADNDGSGRGSRGSRAAACAAEALEPTGPAHAERQLGVGSTLAGRACPDEPDVFVLDTSADAGELLRVSVEQLQGLGELESWLAASTGEIQGPGAASEVRFRSQGRAGAAAREIGFVARGERHVLTVSVFTDLAPELAPGRAYRVTLDRLVRSEGDCCSSTEEAGCADDALLACLCQVDNACCRGPYDATCVAEARASCGLLCGGEQRTASCCTVSGAPGCSERGQEACVCAIDPYCCAGAFDEHCVNLAVGRCGAPCSALDREAP